MEGLGIFVDVSGSVHNTPQVLRLRNTLLKMAHDFQNAKAQPPSVILFDMDIVAKLILTPPEVRLAFENFHNYGGRGTDMRCIQECFNRWCNFGIILTDGEFVDGVRNKNVMYLDIRDDNTYFHIAPNLSKLFL